MSSFNQSFWADSTYTEGYRDTADQIIIDRRMHFFVLQSFYRQFVGIDKGVSVLDLGCGDGILAEQIHAIDPSISATLVDGSDEMLGAAKARFGNQTEIRTCQRTFQDVIQDPSDLGRHDVVISSFAIHHLTLAEKIGLFEAIWQILKPDGYFINIDTVLPDAATHTDWYYTLWGEWLAARQKHLAQNESFAHMPDEARYNPDNKLSTLTSQLAGLKGVGFTDVECHYKYSIFAIYSGCKKVDQSDG